MNNDLTSLVDPEDGHPLDLVGNDLVSKRGTRYPIVRGIPRFVSADNYSEDFGTQWNMFPKTQLDSYTGEDHSAARLARCLRAPLASLKGKKVLEAGSGAGRFTEILLKHGAIVHSLDYSSAVEANAKNNGPNPNLTLVQADIRRIPFAKMSYDYVVCLGVLQHTPSPEESMKSLWAMVRPGGALVMDHYLWKWRNVLPPPIGVATSIYRPVILRLPRKRRIPTVKAITDFWFPLHWRFKDSLAVQRILRRISPIHFYYPHVKLRDKEMYYEWAFLDTHDATTDFYKHHRTAKQLSKFLSGLGASDITVNVGGNGAELFCTRPSAQELGQHSLNAAGPPS